MPVQIAPKADSHSAWHLPQHLGEGLPGSGTCHLEDKDSHSLGNDPHYWGRTVELGFHKAKFIQLNKLHHVCVFSEGYVVKFSSYARTVTLWQINCFPMFFVMPNKKLATLFWCLKVIYTYIFFCLARF